MQYMVIWSDGQKFGPADIDMLNQWAAEGRIKPETELESVVDGTRMSAASLPGLVFPAVGESTDTGTATISEPTTLEPTASASASSSGGEQYFVVGPDGNKYGPADTATLTQWAAENRLNPTSMLEEASSGMRIEAQRVSGIVFPTAAGATGTPIANQYGETAVQSNYPRSYGAQPTEADLKKWNWGGFGLSWIWAINHKYWLGLLALLPCVNIVMAIYMGIKGNEIAWQSGRFSSVEEMHKCQKIWATWAGVILGITCLCYAIQIPLAMTQQGGLGR